MINNSKQLVVRDIKHSLQEVDTAIADLKKLVMMTSIYVADDEDLDAVEDRVGDAFVAIENAIMILEQYS